jgi:arginine/lysine/ornithine decarboxylase
MSRQISRNASEIINLFTTAVQEQQLENDKKELVKFKDAIEKKHKKFLGEKYKEKETLSKNIQNAEKFKSMEDHRIDLDKFAEMYETNR